MNARRFEFEWDDKKASANARKHGVTFELASTVFEDPRLEAIPDVEHSETEERWFSVGCAGDGRILSVVYVWSKSNWADGKIQADISPQVYHD